jgi:ABC-type uncharacterized transport system permease subunit
MRSLKHFALLFNKIYLARLGKDFSLPLVNQLFQITGSFCFFVLHLYAFGLLINKFSFPGWSRPEMWVLLFTFEIFTYGAFYLFWRGFNHTVIDINSGAFDLILAKPITSRFLSFFRGGGLHNIICSFFGFICLGVAIVSFQIPVTILTIFLFLIFLSSSLWIMFCVGVSFISLNLKYGRLNSTIGAVFQVQEAYKYPSTAYHKFNLMIWIILSSLSLLTTLPALVLLSKPLDPKLIALYISFFIVSTYISRFAWNTGLRYYSSASS